MNTELFKKESDYWNVADTIKHLYMSDNSLVTLMDFERVLDENDIYAFRNWILGELVEGPTVDRYTISCTFLWPEHLMPDPTAAKRLYPFGCKVFYKRSAMKVPIEIKKPDDFVPNTKVAKLKEIAVWLVEIQMPKTLINDIRTGSVELEDEKIDLEDLDLAYEEDGAEDANLDNDTEDLADEVDNQDEESPFE